MVLTPSVSQDATELPRPSEMKHEAELVDATEDTTTLQYAHETLHRQLDVGLRKLEFDVFYLGSSQGFVIGHVQVIDMNSHCSCLRDCLGQLLQWSEANPTHAPYWISFNAKDQSFGYLPDPQRFDAAAFQQWTRP